MSETRLNIVDAETIHEGILHASIVDLCVAALTAEPETFAELQAALTRYLKVMDEGPLSALRPSIEVRTEPWDAGIVIIDLAAQVIAWKSTYSQPHPEGSVNYHDGRAATDFSIGYRVPDTWEFVDSIELYPACAASARARRAAGQPLDARSILYGRPLLEFIIKHVKAAPSPQSAKEEDRHDLIDTEARRIHGLWLTTPRADLNAQSPRDVLLARREFVDLDLQGREVQWSYLLEAPPCLSRESRAYRFAGFGTHENVIYYDLVRNLISQALHLYLSGDGETNHNGQGKTESNEGEIESQVARLEEIKQAWLENPQSDCGSRAPVNIIESERRRLPLVLRPGDLIIDDDCPLCVMLAQDAEAGMGVGFEHFDGSNMDDDFAFSFCRTRAEWEEENRRQEEFNRDFDRRWKEREDRIAAGENPTAVDAALGFDYAKEFGDADNDLGGPQLVG